MVSKRMKVREEAVGTIMIRYVVTKVIGEVFPFVQPERTQEAEEPYANVKLFRYKRKWYLRYSEDRCTGHFSSRKKAVEWFNKSGR